MESKRDIIEKKFKDLTKKGIQDELRRRKASLAGKKKVLLDRLVDYEINNNFGNILLEDEQSKIQLIQTPCKTLYKDIHLSSPVPRLTVPHINGFLQLYEKDFQTAHEMYLDGYLLYIKYTIVGGTYYASSKCEAEMHKNLNYEVDISLSMDGEVLESTCECVAGHSTKAHCKHVIATLYGISDAYNKKNITLRHTTTETLQSFHQPAKKYARSPMKAKNMVINRFKPIKKTLFCDEDGSDDENYNIWYKNYFINIIKTRGFNNNMNFKQLTEPANSLGVAVDHDYLKFPITYMVLKNLNLIDVTLLDVENIELETRGQSQNDSWHLYRQCRITASKFYECCRDLNENQSKNLAKSIIDPKKFKSRATSHGKIYEDVALKEFEKFMLQSKLSVDKCGLFIMKEFPYIGASPDGLLGQETCVEIKCPYSSRYSLVSEETISYLEKDKNNNSLTLKKNHPYYYQIQGQMMVTGRRYCDLVIYTFKEVHRISIHRDDIFISDMLNKLIDFNNHYFQEAVLNKHLYHDYDLIKCKCDKF